MTTLHRSRSEGENILLDAYYRNHGRECNLANPQTFSEKLTRRMVKLHRRHNPAMSRLADKFLVREHVGNLVGEDLLVPLLWQGTDPQLLPFDRLPLRYVAKTNHASGHVIVVKGPTDGQSIRKRLAARLRSNYYWAHREAQYYQIAPRIMIEELLEDHDGSAPFEYKVMCFGGTPEVISVEQNGSGTRLLGRFTTAWNKLPYQIKTHGTPGPHVDLPRPNNLEHVLEIAERLARGWDFVRVDLYAVAGHIYFGELTFTPNAGGYLFDPEQWDRILGQKWKLRRPSPAEVEADRVAVIRAASTRAARSDREVHSLTKTAAELRMLSKNDDVVIVVDGGELVAGAVASVTSLPFTERDGQYWGPPADDPSAIAELSRLINKGASHIAFLWPAFWWLDYYAGFAHHLRSTYTCVLSNERLVVYDVRSERRALE